MREGERITNQLTAKIVAQPRFRHIHRSSHLPPLPIVAVEEHLSPPIATYRIECPHKSGSQAGPLCVASSERKTAKKTARNGTRDL